MEDTTLEAHFKNLTEKIDGLAKIIGEVKDENKVHNTKIIEHEQKIEHLKEKYKEEKEEVKQRFDAEKIESEKQLSIVHKKFRRNETNSKWWAMAIIGFSGVIASVVSLFGPKTG